MNLIGLFRKPMAKYLLEEKFGRLSLKPYRREFIKYGLGALKRGKHLKPETVRYIAISSPDTGKKTMISALPTHYPDVFDFFVTDLISGESVTFKMQAHQLVESIAKLVEDIRADLRKDLYIRPII